MLYTEEHEDRLSADVQHIPAIDFYFRGKKVHRQTGADFDETKKHVNMLINSAKSEDVRRQQNNMQTHPAQGMQPERRSQNNRIGVCIFNGLWNLTVPYLMAFLADFDSKGQVVNTGVSLQFVGYAIGPALAAALFETGGYDLINGIAIVLFILSMLLLYPGLRKQSLIK